MAATVIYLVHPTSLHWTRRQKGNGVQHIRIRIGWSILAVDYHVLQCRYPVSHLSYHIPLNPCLRLEYLVNGLNFAYPRYPVPDALVLSLP